MKPIKLVIEGLNSFETKQTLNFDELSGGVFGIFGKTGSGKSTILDAITLALYGKVERTKQNVDFINTKCQKATVSFVFEILTAGKNSTWEITRTFSRKKNGKDIDSSAELFSVDGEEKKLIAENTTKVNDKVFEIVGLGVSEFEKCIALPQGEFAAFLQAKPSERTEIMSRIFDLSKYGDKLTGRVKDRLLEYDKEVSSLEASSKMVEYATNEKLVETQIALEVAKNSYDEKSAELGRLSNDWSNQKQDYEKLQTLGALTESLKELEKEKPDIDKLSEEIEKNLAANQIKNDYDKLQKDENDIKELTQKLSDLNEVRLQRHSSVVEAETKYQEVKNVYDTKIIELNSKIAKLEELSRLDLEIKTYQDKKQETEKVIAEKEKELASERENNSYFDLDISKLQQEIDEIDEFIGSNKADVDLSYALEQTKGVESELILIDDMYNQLEKLFDETSEDLKIVQQEYDQSIVEEKDYQAKRRKIEQSIKVAFEDSDVTSFNKLRSCDKELEGMREVKLDVQKLDEIVQRLLEQNENSKGLISQIESEIQTQQNTLLEIERAITKKEVEQAGERESREELLGENVITMISDHLKIGDICPVCSSRVIQKVYGEKNDLSSVDGEIARCENEIKGLRFERDKIFASVVSLKARVEFEKNQIDSNDREIASLIASKNSLYQRFVDNNDESAANFEKLYGLLSDTADKLEELLILQDSVREAEKFALVQKTQAGTKVSVYKNTLESLMELIYDLQKKKAEREFFIINVNEKYQNLAEYKKQIAEGKNIELVIDGKKERRAELKDKQFELASEKSKSDIKIEKTISDINLLVEKSENYQRTINDYRGKILSSGVPEGVFVSEEKELTQKAIEQIKTDYAEARTMLESCKENLNRTENDYTISSGILESKQQEVVDIKALISATLEKEGFKSFEELESYFESSSIIKLKQERVNNFNDNFRLITAQKQALEIQDLQPVSKQQVEELEEQVSKLNSEVQKLSTEVGRLSSEFERVAVDNQKLNKINEDLAIFRHKYDLAKDLSQILRGKALAEYICEEYLQEITESSNQKLGILMDGRYTLKFENKEFYVIDNFNDGKVRPASTLSGGETFVVSLSLALSISDAISMLSSRSMDFFFLDEGFGTLDNELCAVVVNSLYKLENQNLKIGLISHVAELEESIKNRVIVTKTASGTKLKIEHSL